MSFGLEVYTPSGGTRLSVADRITRVLYFAFVPAGTSGSVTIDGLTSAAAAAFAIIAGSPSINEVPTQVSVSGNTVSWSPPSFGEYSGGSYVYVVATE